MVCIGVVGTVLAFYSIPIAVALVCVGAGSVWLRGYVLPYTPRYGPLLAQQLPIFDSRSRTPSSDGTVSLSHPDGEQVLKTLLDGGVLRAVSGDVELDAGFHRMWKTEMGRLRDRPISELREGVESLRFSDTSDVDVENVRLSDGSQHIVISDETGGDISLSRPATIAELGAVAALTEWFSAGDITERSLTSSRAQPADRELLSAVTALRAFLDTCPSCGSELIVSESGGCCGTPQIRTNRDTPVLSCVECRIVLYAY